MGTVRQLHDDTAPAVPAPVYVLTDAARNTAAAVEAVGVMSQGALVDLLHRMTNYPASAFAIHNPPTLRTMVVAAVIEQREGRDPRGAFRKVAV